MAEQDFITGPFGSATPVARPDVPTAAAAQPAVEQDKLVPFNDAAVAGEPGFAEARAARTDRAATPDTGVLMGIGAAIMTWDTTRALQRFTRPEFEEDTKNFNMFEFREQLHTRFDADEDEYFTSVAKGEKSAQYALKVINDRRIAIGIAGEHQIVGLATQFLDPVWLGIPPAIRIGRLAPAAGRAVSGAASAAIGGGVVAVGEGPVSDLEIGLSMLMNGAVGTALYKPGKGLVNADPSFPDATLDANLGIIAQGAEQRQAMKYRLADEGTEQGRAVVPLQRGDKGPETGAAIEQEITSTIPALDSAKPNYNYGEKAFTVQFDNPLDKAAYIVAGKGESAAHAEIRDWAMQAGAMNEAQLIERGMRIHDDLKEMAAGAEPGALRMSSTRTTPLPHRAETKAELPGKHKYRTFIQGIADSAHPTLAKAARTLMDQADPAVWDMPVRLSGNARANVKHSGIAVLRPDSSPFVVVHEAVHVATIRPIQTLLDGKAHLLGPQTRKGVEGLQKQFDKLKAEWEAETGRKVRKDPPEHVEYAFKDLHEFAAQAISSEKFQKWLAARPGEKSKSAWKEFVKHLAEVLGIKTTGSKLDEVLDDLETLLTARDTHYRDRTGKKVAYAPEDQPKMPFLHEFSTVFSEEAINNAKRYAKEAGAADSTKGRLVMMDVEDFLKLAYPREKTYKDLTASMRTALAEEKRGPIRAAINKGGLDEVPFLTLDGDRVVGHEGRHRADVMAENFYEQIPVVLKGTNIPAPGTRLVSETGEATAKLPETVLKEAQVRAQFTPDELQPGTINSDHAAVAGAVEKALQRKSALAGLGRTLQWNMHKTMSGFGPAGRKVADFLYDNNSDLSITSMESHREAILSDLRRAQFQYEDLLRAAMKDEGYGTLQMVNPLKSREAYAAQARIEREVQRELFRREQVARAGGTADSTGVKPHIAAMADKLDALHAKALAEMKAAGVEGAENILERPGYLNRKWNSQQIDEVIDRFKRLGLDDTAAKGKVVDLVAQSLSRANGMEPKLARQIGSAIIDRALRKGYLEDSAFNAPAGAGTIKEMRDILTASGMPAADVDRAMKVLTGAQDEAGKAGFVKHRMDLDYDTKVQVGDEAVSIMDLIDSRVTHIVDQYTQRVATQSAMARKGMKSSSDIVKMRDELLKDTPAHKRIEAAELFDNTIAHYMGQPAGQRVGDNMRLYQTYGRSIALAWSGLWQLTEIATAMGEYGLLKTMRYAAREIPGFKQMLKPDAETASTLNNVLAEHSMMSLRLRPYLSRFEDGFEMPTGSSLQLAGQVAGQIVPMANAMKFVHHSQARIVGNLILDRLQMAAKGNPKAREALQKYGLEAPVMDKLATEMAAKGLDVDKWDDAIWAEVRPALAKMMDASVLKGRLGDMPAFAVFDAAGKFIFTYRTFVLTAHNKVLMGMTERNGAGAVGLVMMYQFPLAMAAVQAKSVMNGDGPLGESDMAAQAMGQMGGLGLFSMPLAWASGQSTSFGAPGLMPVDRGINMFGALTSGDAGGAASTAATMLPVVSAVPFLRGIPEQFEE